MAYHVLRILFILLLAGVGSRVWQSAKLRPDWIPADWVWGFFLLLGVVIVAIDILIPRKSLAVLSGVFFGLVVGMVAAYGFSLVIDLVVPPGQGEDELVAVIKLIIGITCCYFSISFIIQTKDDIRFIIPYVEFTKQRKGGRPTILDTSVIIDGRIADIVETRIFESQMIVPRFVLHELQTVADSSDRLKRNRGRRGLDILNKLQTNSSVDIKIVDVEFSGIQEGVDQKLVALAQQLDGRIMTNDFNLNKVAQLRGVDVINLNDLANALKPVVLPGERMKLKIIKPGEEPDQGVGYLEDGTMVVAAGGRKYIGSEVDISVTSVLQTSAGRMIFGKTPEALADRSR